MASTTGRHLISILVPIVSIFSYLYLAQRKHSANRVYKYVCHRSWQRLSPSSRVKVPQSQSPWSSSSPASSKLVQPKILINGLPTPGAGRNNGQRLPHLEFEESVLIQGSRLPKIDNLVKTYYYLLWASQFFYIIKYSAICLVDFDYFQDYAWLDCYLVGRFTLSSRLTRTVNYVIWFVIIALQIWRSRLFILLPNFRLECLEFMLYDYNEVLINEIQAFEAGNDPATKEFKEVNRFIKRSHNRRHFSDLTDKVTAKVESIRYYDAVIYLKNQFVEGEKRYVIKPNRTTEAWKLHSLYIIIYFAVNLVILVGSMIAYFILAFPLSTTELGFELTYSKCCEWIRKLNSTDRQLYAHIYEPRELNHENLPVILPYQGFKQLNYYTIIKVFFDFSDGYVYLMNTIVTVTFPILIGFMIALDCYIYSQEIHERLMRLNSKLKAEQILTDAPFKSNQSFISHKKEASYMSISDSFEETTELQAIVVEYFNLIRDYNRYASDMTAFAMILWLAYTGLICYWILIPGGVVRKEWYTIQVIVTVYLSIIFGSFAVVKQASCKIYRSLTSNMALDKFDATTKYRWSRILQYYSPTPMFCFAIFSSVQISWLLFFKLMIWVLSALLVMSNLLATQWIVGSNSDQSSLEIQPHNVMAI